MTTAALARDIKEIRSLLEINDLINEEEAARLLGVKLVTLRTKVYKKELEGYYIINAIGHRNFYKSKLLGLNIK